MVNPRLASRTAPEVFGCKPRHVLSNLTASSHPRAMDSPVVAPLAGSSRDELKADGRESTIVWNDENDSPSPDATTLRGLIKEVRGMIEGSKEYKALPEARGRHV
jgi:hypothetical protein